MVCTISLDDRVMPYHPIEHSDTIHILQKLYYTPIFYPKDSNSLNQARAHLWQETYVYLPKIPQPNLLVKRVPLPNFLIEGR
jgi:hypothetical protein